MVGANDEGIRRESERNELSVGAGAAGRAAMEVELEEEGKEAAAAGVPEGKRGRGKKVTFSGERGGVELGW
jgi:hypothetical protein